MLAQRRRIKVDIKKCTGCRLCETICSITRSPEGLISPLKSAIRVHFDQYQRKDRINVCFQCKKASCMDSCDTNALYREDGIIKFDDSLCTGCQVCISACSFDTIWFFPQSKKIIKCDLCTNHKNIYCVENCPVGAITVMEK